MIILSVRWSLRGGRAGRAPLALPQRVCAMARLRWGALLLAVGVVRGEDGAAATISCDDATAELDGANMQPAEDEVVRDESWTTWTDVLVGDVCEGTAVGETCGDFACQAGYEGGQLMCGEGGVWVVDACSAIICTTPEDSAGYVVSESQLDVSQTFHVTASCAPDYIGTAAVTACETGGQYRLAGCEKAPPPPEQAPDGLGGQAIAQDTLETCHVSDDLTCVGFAVAVCALAAALAAMVLLPKMMHTPSALSEGRSLYSDEGAGDDLDLLESLEDQNVEEYGDQDEHAAKKRLRGSKRGGRGRFQAVAESDEVIQEP